MSRSGDRVPFRRLMIISCRLGLTAAADTERVMADSISPSASTEYLMRLSKWRLPNFRPAQRSQEAKLVLRLSSLLCLILIVIFASSFIQYEDEDNEETHDSDERENLT